MAVSRIASFGLSFVQANCLATDVVGDAVYITGPDVGGLYQVAKADPSNPNKMPAVGIIQAKFSSTWCQVRLLGELPGIYSGFTPGKVLYVGASGQPSHTPGAIFQVIGVATSDDIIFVSPEYSAPDRDSIIFGAGTVLASTRTRYLFSGYSDSPAELTPIQVASPRTGLVQSLQIFHNVLGVSSNPIAYRIRVGNIPTTLNTIVLADVLYGATIGGSVPVVLGQPIDVEVTKLFSLGSSPANIVAIVEVI